MHGQHGPGDTEGRECRDPDGFEGPGEEETAREGEDRGHEHAANLPARVEETGGGAAQRKGSRTLRTDPWPTGCRPREVVYWVTTPSASAPHGWDRPP
ncbi:hypothetical protein GCM10009737_07330 [Nocardioides lentus]|uniref:Uncharacterized protein n=1 Tax=Nocardioides lentus TaxID=338077 RepID=A0ABN2P073_9ACTN